MVGYAVSASSDTSLEHILITVYDEDDFAFVNNGNSCAVYKYSRVSRLIEKLEGSAESITLPDGVIYEISRFIKHEEILQSFPVAISWRKPEFSGLEITSAELQNMWPASMMFKNEMRAAYVNVTGEFFNHKPKPFEVSFLCDILNLLMFKSGVYADVPFCHCFNSVFCDIRVIYALKRIFGKHTFETELSSDILKKLSVNTVKKLEFSKRASVTKLKKFRFEPSGILQNASFIRRFSEVKRKTLNGCMRIAKSYAGGCPEDVMKLFGACIRDGTDEIYNMSSELCDKYVIDSKADINYLTLNDLLSAFAFADDRMDLKSVIRTFRAKNSIAKKHEPPMAVLPSGEFVF